ncbi:MAG: EAL domain-containing protein [Selenomonas sp.]|nr:EAL domain-containing protein [Selenomonas sp.]
MKKNERIPLSPCLRRFKFFFDLLKQTTDNYLFFADMQEDLVIVSPNLVQDFDLPAEVMHDFDTYWAPLVHPEERSVYLAAIRGLMKTKSIFEHNMEYRVKTRQGEYAWIRCRGRVGMDREGNPSIFARMMSRMAQRNQADEVTGLLNKYQFEHAVKLALGQYRATGEGGAILALGLDNFKIVNETYNRVVGDIVLKRVGELIANVLPTPLTLFKLDGDQFAVIYPGASEQDVADIFASVQSTLSRPQDINGHQYFCTASCGTVFYPTAGKDYLVLHKHAEAAMDIAKREGKNRNILFSKDQYNRWVRSISMRDSLWDSVENGCLGFSLYYQPQISAVDQKLIGAEALLRWKNPKGRMVAPMEFIPILEETKLIIPVGKWIFEEAVKVCKRWRHIVPEFKVSVNMSYEQVKDLSFKNFVTECLLRHDMPPESVILELTESKIVADWSFVNKQFDSFRKQGIAIAMDDFGTGYSSLASLKYLSCDIVKIDREFVKKILENDFDRKLVQYVVALCHSIGIKCCIEGVEEEAEYELLTRECKADSIQGYLFGHPESVENFEEKFLQMEKH